MALTVAQIAAKAYTAVSKAIPDAIHAGVLNDGSTDYSGRVVQDYAKPSGGFMKAVSVDGSTTLFLEGFTTAPQDGWSITYGGNEYMIIEVEDIAGAGTFFGIDALLKSDWLSTSIAIRRKGRIANGSGGFTEVWSTVTTVDAYVGAVSGDELTGGTRIEAHAMLKVYMKHYSGLKESDLVQFGSRDYPIQYVNNIDNKSVWHELHIECGGAS